MNAGRMFYFVLRGMLPNSHTLNIEMASDWCHLCRRCEKASIALFVGYPARPSDGSIMKLGDVKRAKSSDFQ